MSNTGYKWIYKKVIPRLKNPIRYIVRVYYGAKDIELGGFESLEMAIKIRDRYIRDNEIDEQILKRYNRKENG